MAPRNKLLFHEINPLFQKCFIAMVCCPYQLFPEIINAIFRHYKLSRSQCESLWDYIGDTDLLSHYVSIRFTNDGIEDRGSFYFFYGDYPFATVNFYAIFEIIKGLNGDCSVLDDKELWADVKKAVLKSKKVGIDTYEPEELHWFLRRFISKGKASAVLCPASVSIRKKDNYCEPLGMVGEFLPLLERALTDDEDYQAFFTGLGEEAQRLVVREHYFYEYCPVKAEQAFKILEYFKNAESTDFYRDLKAWALMQDFFEKGNLKDHIARMPDGTVECQILQALDLFLNNQAAEAVKIMRKALLQQKKQQWRNEPTERFFGRSYENWFYGLFLYHSSMVPANEKTINALLKDKKKDFYRNALTTVFCALAREEDPANYCPTFINVAKRDKIELPWITLGYQVIRYGFHAHCLNDAVSMTTTAASQCRAQGALFPLWYQTFLAVTSPNSNKLPELEKSLQMKPIVSFVKEKPEWEKILDKVLEYERQNAGEVTVASKNVKKGVDRYAYYLTFHDEDDIKNRAFVDPFISIRFQHSRDGGQTWARGREIKLKTFKEEPLKSPSPVDQAMLARVKVQSYVHWNHRLVTEYYLSGAETASELIGCPHVYDEYGDPLEIVKGSVHLAVKPQAKGYVISTNIDDLLPASKDLSISPWIIDTPKDGRVTVYNLTSDQQRIITDLRNAGLMPREAENKLTALLETISSKLPVMSNLLKDSDKFKKLKGDSHILLQLSQPSSGVFEAQAVVRPASGSKLTCKPGSGQQFIATVVDNANVQIERDLKAEKKNFKALEELLSPLDECRYDEYAWSLTTEPCLDLLNLVRDSKLCTVQWPEGEKFKIIKAPLTFSNLNLSVRSIGSWFEVSGEVNIDAKTKMQVEDLMRLISESSGSYISLGNNEYIALTESLKKQLSFINKTAFKDGKKLKVSRFNSGVFDDLEKNGSEIKSDRQYQDLKKRLDEASAYTPMPPKNLNAVLRDYQEEGFEWMMRLAFWGAGAVLADDMGLGKTVQTISVLLARASLGAQIVVAPAALLINWKNELQRFAPSLKPVVLNFEADRAAVIKKAAANTVLLVTYGVVTEEIEDIAPKQFATAVFDEAHNIKNHDTKAFKSCVQLKADFRIMLTGTPLQNHLTEIWSLFEIAVPGLLGNFNGFQERFVMPVERDHDVKQQRLLKRIVSPFILRRTKADVLSELPEKTEITVEVDLSAEEKALYEHLREQAAVSLDTGEINPVQALAALTKLRQAACSMELIDPKLTLTSSKTEAFLNLVDELIENNHRALVFSQFTSHLAIIRRELDRKNIRYLYLDGSMSPKERMKLVDKFDENDMPLFLISLKAGGTGLNLTAADYVIHMDPWWNPAIEDQASDRAYRIGQERQVTVYRLIAKGTVEDKILKLHSTKKSLADALLEGSEMSSRLGREEIMELLELARS